MLCRSQASAPARGADDGLSKAAQRKGSDGIKLAAMCEHTALPKHLVRGDRVLGHTSGSQGGSQEDISLGAVFYWGAWRKCGGVASFRALARSVVFLLCVFVREVCLVWGPLCVSCVCVWVRRF